MILIKSFYFFKQFVNSSGNETCIILIRLQILKECVLLLFRFRIFRNRIFPITAEHSMCLSRACLAIREDSEVVALWDFGNVLCEEVKEIFLVGSFGYCLIKLYGEGCDGVSCYINCFALGIKHTIHLKRLQLLHCFLVMSSIMV